MTRTPRSARRPAAADQADGLRRMFAGGPACLVPLVANPHVEQHGALVARLAGVFAAQGLNTLVVDAADTAPAPGELAFIDLAACVEPLGPSLAYLAARGLPMKQVDTHGSCAAFVPLMMQLVPDVDVVVLHAEARVLARMLGSRDLRPVLLASGETDSLTHAYAALKLLSQRLGLASFDMLMPTARPGSPAALQLAERIADCADRFLGVALHDWAAIQPDPPLGRGAESHFGPVAEPDLQRLAAAHLGIAGVSSAPMAGWPTAHTGARLAAPPLSA